MFHRRTAHTLAWIIVFGVALTGDGIVVGSSELALVGAGLALPAIVLARVVRRSRRRKGARRHTASRSRALPLEVRERSTAASATGVGISAWENEGGARQTA